MPGHKTFIDIPVATFAGGGLPSAADNRGRLGILTDVGDGTLYLSDGSAWNQVAGSTQISGSGSGGAIIRSLLDAKGDLIVASGADIPNRLAVGATYGMVPTVDPAASVGLKWRDSYDPRNMLELYEDFMWDGTITAGAIGNLGWGMVISGTGATVALPATATAGVYGETLLQTGTTTTGRCGIRLGSLAMSGLASGDTFSQEWRVNVDTLSTAGEEFIQLFGLVNVVGATLPGQGFWFEYDRLNSANWRLHAADGATTATTTSSTAVATGYKRYRIDCDGTTVTFYVDDVSIGTVTTNLPSALGFNPAAKIVKSAGTTSRQMRIDYMKLRYLLGSAR